MLLSCHQEDHPEAGCDEAGRGCLAGPVFAAAVILPKDFRHPILNDSKQIAEEDRYALRKVIESEALAYAVASVDHEEIDRINILNASILAMHKALDMLAVKPGFILVDGNRFKKYGAVPHACMIKGDARFFSIAAASILAKTYRDDYMMALHKEYPEYHWHTNKGYPTTHHRQTVLNSGFSPYHRRTFRVSDPQISILFEEML